MVHNNQKKFKITFTDCFILNMYYTNSTGFNCQMEVAKVYSLVLEVSSSVIASTTDSRNLEARLLTLSPKDFLLELSLVILEILCSRWYSILVFLSNHSQVALII